ncbi:hypothetical protein A2803_04425 [Candidatus Woesebacteria bacterium RIFCSPHIGHO2_01_FULL_44_21]|uniref:SHS2 domain-containing protein n=1 Tax=Candidatus Woesebacteria bacterium RIFCSPHIGHO2_01_FULL_44_21 TaxID=1802503 RepID=A0A1F7YWC2_9BACT|nr:MAG: hypothetical protein A2803_04425 [Candidatus Woesebacteria bacterium RIFCSPHIGHO2_01_FULL_44_21]OGM71318.1 MAG: hypothetical protein A2897_00790 [Candidatus Woesebacteria bacterium RIFCSPLOWO2_01_FULL_44_24b]
MKLPNFSLFKRTFISVVMSPRQIKAIKVNTKTGKVIKFAQIELPVGVIVNYRVKEKELLAKYLRELWDKNKIRDKYVGVVVPEFSTFTKSLELPNITDVEIAEALSFRMQEFLPTNVEDVVFDWKISKREKEKARVLVVAILKDVLFGYIDAVGAAGLSPLVVETPSMSIQRIIDKDPSGKMILYMGPSEAILVITAEQEIVASSVINSDNINSIVTTARQMLAHYSAVTVEKVMVSGVGLTQDLIQFLNYNLGRPVQFADVKAAGLLPGQVQDYLVGLSLQYKDPAEPASETTINLLPPSWADYYKTQSTGIRAWTLTLIASIIVWSTFLFVTIVFMVLRLQAQSLESSAADGKTGELNIAVTRVNEVNALAENVIKYNQSLVPPQAIINLLSDAKTEGISLNYYKVNYETGEVIIRGLAATRSNLLAFKNSVEALEKLSAVHLPVTSLVEETNISFEMSLSYSDFVAKNRAPVKLKI